MNFQNYITLKESEEKTNNFCYMIYPEFPDFLAEIQETLQETNKQLFLNAKPETDYHATIRYVKLQPEQTPDLFIEYLDTIQLPEITAFTSDFTVLGDDKCFCLKVESDDIHNWFQKTDAWLTTHNYSKSDYPTYKPHITLFSGYQSLQLPKFNPRIHRIKIKFTIHKVSNSAEKIIFEKKTDLFNSKLGFGIFD